MKIWTMCSSALIQNVWLVDITSQILYNNGFLTLTLTQPSLDVFSPPFTVVAPSPFLPTLGLFAVGLLQNKIRLISLASYFDTSLHNGAWPKLHLHNNKVFPAPHCTDPEGSVCSYYTSPIKCGSSVANKFSQHYSWPNPRNWKLPLIN